LRTIAEHFQATGNLLRPIWRRLEETLLRVSRLIAEVPEIRELDLNPIFALPPRQGCRVVDARIRVIMPINA
jgi:hypothetical protein